MHSLLTKLFSIEETNLIKTVTIKNKRYSLVKDGYVNRGKNIYSIITGKNGVGKSRLLSAIVNDFITFRAEDIDRFYINGRERNHENSNCHIEQEYVINKIIAVSTSAFDKFPVPRKRERIEYYSYLGVRGLSNTLNLSKEYLSRIISKLISSILYKKINMEEIGRVLAYLGYDDQIEISFNYKFSNAKLKTIIESNDVYETFSSEFFKGNPFNSINLNNYIDKESGYNENHIWHTIDMMKGLSVDRTGRSGTIRIHGNNLVFEDRDVSYDDEKINAFVHLLEQGFITAKDIHLKKRDSGFKYKISDASSGEQCIVMSIIGIASQIEDNSLICIDEPEICLHPEWQERYIPILIDTFRHYSGCHFIIATHSPQITSKLIEENCFVISMQDGFAKDAKEFVNKSIDFQLASIFKAPGYKNEYLTRVLVSYLASVSANEKITYDEQANIKEIISLKASIDEKDPVRKLIALAEKAMKVVKNGD